MKNGVSAVFHGHDHLFAKQDLDGIVYQDVPQPGHRQYSKPRNAADYGYTHGDVRGENGPLRVSIANGQAKVDFIISYLPEDETAEGKNGAVAYSYNLTAAGK